MSSTRIALLSYDLNPLLGGQGRHFQRLSIELEKRLHDSKNQIIELTPSYFPNVFIRTNKLLGKRWSAIIKYLTFLMLINLRLEREIKKNNINLVIMNSGPGGVLLLKKPSIKFLVLANHTYAQQIKYLPEQRWKFILKLLEARVYKIADHIFSISNSTRASLKSDYKIPDRKITLVPIGVDLPVGSIPKAIEIGAKTGPLLYVGRLDHRKGVDFLLNVALELKIRKVEFSLTIIGKGPLQDYCQNFIICHELSQQVKMLGFVSDQELQQLYQDASIFVVPSVFEGLGISALEASAYGLPIVARNVPGLSDVVVHEKTGLLIEPNDNSAFATACEKLLAEPSLRHALGARAREHVGKKFCWDKIIPKYLELFQDL